MAPKFTTALAWQQAELLMQPALIRVLDNIRKQLDESTWAGHYENVQIFPAGTTPAEQNQVMQLQRDLETVSDSSRLVTIQQQLDELPHPYLGYELRLTQGDRTVSVDIWELCYQVCFKHYDRSLDPMIEQPIAIDTRLIAHDNEVDWKRLDEKAKKIIETVFANLPQ